MNKRDQIMARVRKALADAPSSNRRTFRHVTPRVSGNLLKRFIERVQVSAASVEQCAADEVVQCVERFREQQELIDVAAIAPGLADRDWGLLPVSPESSDGSHSLSIVEAVAGIAETGSLVLPSSAQAPANNNFLPDVGIIIVAADAVVKRLEDVWPTLISQGMPRVVNLVTGPSRTADVEQTIQLGAHGPRRVHVIVTG